MPGRPLACDPKVHRNETYISAVEAAPRAHPRFPRPHEHRRGPEGPVGTARQGPRPPVGLTAQANAARAGSARYRLRGASAFASVFKLGVRHDARFLQLIAAPAAQPEVQDASWDDVTPVDIVGLEVGYRLITVWLPLLPSAFVLAVLLRRRII